MSYREGRNSGQAMISERERRDRMSATEWLLVALVLSLPFMKPAISYPLVLPDLVFLLLFFALGVELFLRKRRIEWGTPQWILLLYVLSFAPSLLTTPDLRESTFKLATQLYLVGLAVVTAALIDSEAKLRFVAHAWLCATGLLAIVALLSLAAFVVAPDSALLDYSRYHFGTLPPGHYPRLALTFFNVNMLCNYLTVSLGLLFVSRQAGWLSRRTFVLLIVAIGVAAVPTLSPGLGGIVLIAGLWLWLTERSQSGRLARAAVAVGIAVGAFFVVALGVTPILHSTAPFLIHIPRIELVLAPSARFLTWNAAVVEFARHPLVGHGIGIDAVDVRYKDPSGYLQELTDAHNMFFNIAAQCGVAGLAGLAGLIVYVLRLSLPWRLDGGTMQIARVGLGITFLDAFVYQGLGGSFEDTRHLWVLLGLLIASARLEISPADGSNRRAGAPLFC
jgi:putative inorganic carbon (hco3(-)) transporter